MRPIPNTPWLEHLSRHLPLAREGTDAEGVHQVRVAAARLGVWLELAGWRILRDDLRWLRGSAGRVREIDVLLESELPRAFADWLRERRDRKRTRMLDCLDAPRLAGLLSGLAQLPPLSAKRAHRRLGRYQRIAARRGRALERHPRDVRRCHRLRKALRRVRYALEWSGESPDEIRGLQSSLGELNDAAVGLELLCRFPDGARHPELREKYRERIEEQRRLSLKAWKRSKLRKRSGR